MKTLRSILFCVSMSALAISSCKKEAAPAPVPTGNTGPKIDTDVYIGGQVTATNGNSVSAYWKNGVLTKLSDTTKNAHSTSIAVDGIDVYVAGYYDDGGIGIAAYWKNNKNNETKLKRPSPDTTTSVYAYGIGVNSNGVYITGEIDGPKGTSAVYWKDNGMPVSVATGGGAGATALVLNGTNVGIAGHFNGRSAYWKNGSVQLSTDQLFGSANAIASNGTDIYTAGYSTANTGKRIATYWKNGSPAYLTDGSTNAYATGVAIKNNVVYSTGYTFAANGNSVACYWKDKRLVSLSDYTQKTIATDIAFVGNDVYVMGTFTDLNGHRSAIYWKNGVMKTLPGAGINSYTSGIVVVTHPH